MIYPDLRLIEGESIVLGVFLVVVLILSLFSPLSYLNLMGRRAPFNTYIRIKDGVVNYKLYSFLPAKSFTLGQVKKISRYEDVFTFELQNGRQYNMAADKIIEFGNIEKRVEFVKWVNACKKKLHSQSLTER